MGKSRQITIIEATGWLHGSIFMKYLSAHVNTYKWACLFLGPKANFAWSEISHTLLSLTTHFVSRAQSLWLHVTSKGTQCGLLHANQSQETSKWTLTCCNNTNIIFKRWIRILRETFMSYRIYTSFVKMVIITQVAEVCMLESLISGWTNQSQATRTFDYVVGCFIHYK